MRGICDRYYLFPLLIELPVLAFFVFFFFGQQLTGGHLVHFMSSTFPNVAKVYLNLESLYPRAPK